MINLTQTSKNQTESDLGTSVLMFLIRIPSKWVAIGISVGLATRVPMSFGRSVVIDDFLFFIINVSLELSVCSLDDQTLVHGFLDLVMHYCGISDLRLEYPDLLLHGICLYPGLLQLDFLELLLLLILGNLSFASAALC